MQAWNLSSEEKLLVKLHSIAKRASDDRDRAGASSLILWYQRHGCWTFKQKNYAGFLCSRKDETFTARAPRSKPCYWLYAVRLGDELKVGHAINVHKRVKSYVTSSSQVELIHEIRLGQCGIAHAKVYERKLHAFLKKRGHWIVRELFRLSAIDDVRGFVPKKLKSDKSAQQPSAASLLSL